METFVVRLFKAAGGEPVPLRGVAEHVASGAREPFESATQLIRLLEARLPKLAEPDRDAVQMRGDAK